MNDLALIDPRLCALSPTQARFKEGLSLEDWKKVGRALSRASRAIHWWVGDWLAYGSKQYGQTQPDSVTQLEWAEQFGFQPEALRGCLLVSAKVAVRYESLSWQHHREVSALAPKQQKQWLKQADDNRWSVSELRQAIRADGAQVEEGTHTGEFNPLRTVLDLKRWAQAQDVSTWDAERKAAFRKELQPVVDL